MEVCLEAEGLEGCFVAVRVGDVQKLSRYNPAQSLRFPERKKSVKVDIFRRIGQCEVRMDPAWSGDSQVCSVKKLEDSLDELQLRCTTRLVEPIPELDQVLSCSSGNVRAHDHKARSGSRKYSQYLARHGPHGVEEMISGAMRSLLKKPETAPPLLSDYFANKDTVSQQLQEGSIVEDHFPTWPVDDDRLSQKMTRCASTGALDNGSLHNRQSNRPCSRQDERACSRQSNRPCSRQSGGHDDRPCSRRSAEQDSRPPSRQSNRPLSRQSISRAMLPPLEKSPPLPEIPDKVPLDVESQSTSEPAVNPTHSTFLSKPFLEHYREHIAPTCGKEFWSSLYTKFAKVEVESAPSASPSVPLLSMPSRPGTAVGSRPGSAAAPRTPKPQVLLSGGRLHVLADAPLESGRSRRCGAVSLMQEEDGSCEVLTLTERSVKVHVKDAGAHQLNYTEEMKILRPCLECLTVN